jgi:hypothetical protein
VKQIIAIVPLQRGLSPASSALFAVMASANFRCDDVRNHVLMRADSRVAQSARALQTQLQHMLLQNQQ